MDLEMLAGAVGVTLVIAVGGVLDDVRDWLLGFSVPANPLRLLGHALSSTLVVGFCVGAALANRIGHDALMAGGIVALASAAADETLAFGHGIVRWLVPPRMPMPMPNLVSEPEKKKKTGPITEDEAHAEMDRRDAEAEGREP